MAEEVECFMFLYAIHEIGNSRCGGCHQRPTPCPEPECLGLVHHDLDADGDSESASVWCESCCDTCNGGDNARDKTLFSMNREDLEAGWQKSRVRRTPPPKASRKE